MLYQLSYSSRDRNGKGTSRVACRETGSGGVAGTRADDGTGAERERKMGGCMGSSLGCGGHDAEERVKGIEPSSLAWKAIALPLSYTRGGRTPGIRLGSAGFEPAKAMPSDLQSDPFDRSGNSPHR